MFKWSIVAIEFLINCVSRIPIIISYLGRQMNSPTHSRSSQSNYITCFSEMPSQVTDMHSHSSWDCYNNDDAYYVPTIYPLWERERALSTPHSIMIPCDHRVMHMPHSQVVNADGRSSRGSSVFCRKPPAPPLECVPKDSSPGKHSWGPHCSSRS